MERACGRNTYFALTYQKGYVGWTCELKPPSVHSLLCVLSIRPSLWTIPSFLHIHQTKQDQDQSRSLVPVTSRPNKYQVTSSHSINREYTSPSVPFSLIDSPCLIQSKHHVHSPSLSVSPLQGPRSFIVPFPRPKSCWLQDPGPHEAVLHPLSRTQLH